MSSKEDLWSTWSSAAEVILHPGDEKPTWLAPGNAATTGEKFPSLLLEHPHFALTAFDPPGVERTLFENTAENGKLYQRLLDLKEPEALHIIPSFGFSLSEGWREDGFVVGFETERLDEARAEIVAVAKEFHQGAIFEYARSDAGEEFLKRTTVPALSHENAEEVLIIILTLLFTHNKFTGRRMYMYVTDRSIVKPHNYDS